MNRKSIKGNNKISFEIIKDVTNPVFQIDLQQPMKADKVEGNFPIANYKQDGDFIFITTNKKFKKAKNIPLTLPIPEKPTIAKKSTMGWRMGFHER